MASSEPMRTIHKYPIRITDYQLVKLPQNYKILKLEMIGLTPVLWVEIDSTKPEQYVAIRMYKTDAPINPHLTLDYLGSCPYGLDHFHVFLCEINEED